MAAETSEARARDRLDAMQAQLAEAHAVLQAAAETERRAGAGREAERTRADTLADRVHVLQAELATAEAEGNTLTVGTAELTAQVKAAKAEAREAQDAAEALRQADAARKGRGRLARLRAAWRGK